MTRGFLRWRFKLQSDTLSPLQLRRWANRAHRRAGIITVPCTSRQKLGPDTNGRLLTPVTWSVWSYKPAAQASDSYEFRSLALRACISTKTQIEASSTSGVVLPHDSGVDPAVRQTPESSEQPKKVNRREGTLKAATPERREPELTRRPFRTAALIARSLRPNPQKLFGASYRPRVPLTAGQTDTACRTTA